LNSANSNRLDLYKFAVYKHSDHNIWVHLDISCNWKFEILKRMFHTLEEGMTLLTLF